MTQTGRRNQMSDSTSRENAKTLIQFYRGPGEEIISMREQLLAAPVEYFVGIKRLNKF